VEAIRLPDLVGCYAGCMMGSEDSKALAQTEPEVEIDEDPALTAELGRRLDALLRGEAKTISRAEMKERLARRRAARLEQ
jgi:hypothetical protein